jgi:SAM-dependent methyltransferase
MIILPDHLSERTHLTSLRAERFAAVLPEIRGRCLDIGAGNNELVQLYQQMAPAASPDPSVGVDVVDWGHGATRIDSVAFLPFADRSFDTVCFVACLNHIPERRDALREARRVLRPNGRVLITMIGRVLGTIGHALWWYSEDKHRPVAAEETMGMDSVEILELLQAAGFTRVAHRRFFYGLNHLFIASVAEPASERRG